MDKLFQLLKSQATEARERPVTLSSGPDFGIYSRTPSTFPECGVLNGAKEDTDSIRILFSCNQRRENPFWFPAEDRACSHIWVPCPPVPGSFGQKQREPYITCIHVPGTLLNRNTHNNISRLVIFSLFFSPIRKSRLGEVMPPAYSYRGWYNLELWFESKHINCLSPLSKPLLFPLKI